MAGPVFTLLGGPSIYAACSGLGAVRCAIFMQVIKQDGDVRTFGVFDGGEQHSMRAGFGEAPQFGQCRLVGRVKQFAAVALGKCGVAVVAVGVIPA